ncbi:hypothetical protein DM02DRAFT_675495 [Periconia macrospinosa]|uniref:Uncharacterized protein n=1 Tax=Periconia macrospinosa TaxID=97972 RepID=A0A2V1DBG4_9PLEO|nr:hypothetical protein DM02DRAFT_675495 [Periconia macrospinosa]
MPPHHTAQGTARLHTSLHQLIIFESDIATLKHLRLACRNFNALIEVYGISIHVKNLARAYTQDLVDCFDIQWRERNHLTACFITDGRILDARWCLHIYESSTVQTESTLFVPSYRWMAAVRLRVTGYYPVMGLGIMWHLHDCATQEMCLDFGHDALHSAAYMSAITIEYPQLEDLEARILRKQIAFVGLFYALGFCVPVLHESRAFTPKSIFDALNRNFELYCDSMAIGSCQTDAQWADWKSSHEQRSGADWISRWPLFIL